MSWKVTAFAAAVTLSLAGCHRHTAVGPTGNPGPDSDNATDSTGSPASEPSFVPAKGSPLAPSDIGLLEQINRENIRVIGSALPGIVRISARIAVDPHSELGGNLSHIPFPFERHDAGPFSEVAYGSGVVLKKDGYIVTNSHVVDEAESIEVQLQDHRVFPATVLQANAQLDVAVLKIAATDLKPLPWGDSDKVRVGEQVFAIGNPFDLGDSASRGIISATGRAIPEPSSSFEDFLQTDAAINPGNSGGALINIRGELIGINVEIASITGADRGVGFALPSNLLRYAVSGLLEHGHNAGAFLGVTLPTAVDEGVLAQLGLGSGEGALLAGVYPSSPAARARLRAADFITAIDGHKIGSIPELQVIAPQLPIGRAAEVAYIRDGQPHTTLIRIARGPSPHDPPPAVALSEQGDAAPGPLVPAGTVPNALSGLQVTSLSAKLRAKWHLDNWLPGGAVITGVQDGSVVESRGLQQGDVIELACARRAAPLEITGAPDLARIATDLRPDQGIALLVHHSLSTRFIYLPPLR